MMPRSLRSLTRSLPLSLLALAAVACQAKVTVGGGDGGGGGGEPCGITGCCDADCDGEGGGDVVSSNGIAVAWSQLGGEVLDAPDDTLLLVFGSEAAACADPLGPTPSCEPELSWRAEIPLPAALQAAGAVVALEDLLDVGYGPFFSESQGAPDGTCSGGGGTLTGTLEVLAIDANSVTIRLSDTLTLDAAVDGERTLARCSGGEPPPEGGAVALTDEQLDALYGGGTGSSGQTGGGPDPAGRLYVFVDASAPPAPLTCADPYAFDATCAVERTIVVLGLDPAEQVVGVHPMGDLGVTVSLSESGPNGDGTCWGGGGGGWDDGTVEIVAIDGQTVEVVVTGGPLAQPLGAVATRCP